MRYYQADRRMMALMIEVNRRLYMNEATGERGPAFADVASAVRSIVSALVAPLARRDAAYQ